MLRGATRDHAGQCTQGWPHRSVGRPSPVCKFQPCPRPVGLLGAGWEVSRLLDAAEGAEDFYLDGSAGERFRGAPATRSTARPAAPAPGGSPGRLCAARGLRVHPRAQPCQPAARRHPRRHPPGRLRLPDRVGPPPIGQRSHKQPTGKAGRNRAMRTQKADWRAVRDFRKTPVRTPTYLTAKQRGSIAVLSVRIRCAS